MLTIHKFSDTGIFRHLSIPAFSRVEVQQKIGYEGHIFFQIIPNFIYTSLMQ